MLIYDLQYHVNIHWSSLVYIKEGSMNLFKDLKKKCARKNKDENIYYVMIEKLKPWIVINCLEKENYIITENTAETLAITIIKQAIRLNILDKVVKNIGEI